MDLTGGLLPFGMPGTTSSVSALPDLGFLACLQVYCGGQRIRATAMWSTRVVGPFQPTGHTRDFLHAIIVLSAAFETNI